jgi:hypothetical protein
VTPHTRATLLVASFAAIPAVVLGVIGVIVAGPVVGAVVLVVVAVALVAWARFAGDRRVLAAIGGRDADPVIDARLWNLTEGLSIGAGLRQPRLRVIDVPTLNAMAARGSPGRGADPDPAPGHRAGDRLGGHVRPGTGDRAPCGRGRSGRSGGSRTHPLPAGAGFRPGEDRRQGGRGAGPALVHGPPVVGRSASG